MSFLLVGKKIGMHQIFDESGSLIPVTVVRVEPAYVSQIKSKSQDGYEAVQFAAMSQKEERVSMPVRGHLKKAGLGSFSVIREFRPKNKLDNYQIGDLIDVRKLSVGQKVDVIGTSIGKGFEGVIRRYGFKMQPMSHGSMAHRRPGSIGHRQWPAEVIKNKKMPGRMGFKRCTVQNLVVVKVIEEEQVVCIKGALPGNASSLLYIRPAKKSLSQV